MINLICFGAEKNNMKSDASKFELLRYVKKEKTATTYNNY